MQAVTDRLKNFLQYVAVNLIDEPAQAQLKVAELGPKRLRFKLVLAKPDVAMLIGRNGFTASAIRSVLKAAAEREGVQVSLQIHSHEEEAELLAKGDGHP
ncbi:KH domain-containing protein [bacterium]|nr:KH domain-containing protein [bacterium]